MYAVVVGIFFLHSISRIDSVRSDGTKHPGYEADGSEFHVFPLSDQVASAQLPAIRKPIRTATLAITQQVRFKPAGARSAALAART
jgi:hypothetical protein